MRSVRTSVILCAGSLYSNQPMSLKLGVLYNWAYQSKELIKCTCEFQIVNLYSASSQKAALMRSTVLDTDSGLFFHFHHHCGIGDFRRFISIVYTVTGRFARHSAKCLTPTT